MRRSEILVKGGKVRTRCATLHQPELCLKLPTRRSTGNIEGDQHPLTTYFDIFPEGEDDIEEIHLELDLPSFDRWIYTQ